MGLRGAIRLVDCLCRRGECGPRGGGSRHRFRYISISVPLSSTRVPGSVFVIGFQLENDYSRRVTRPNSRRQHLPARLSPGVILRFGSGEESVREPSVSRTDRESGGVLRFLFSGRRAKTLLTSIPITRLEVI